MREHVAWDVQSRIGPEADWQDRITNAYHHPTLAFDAVAWRHCYHPLRH